MEVSTQERGKEGDNGPPPDQETLDHQILADALQVAPDAAACIEDLIRRSVVQHFPSLPPGGGEVLTAEQLDGHLRRVKRDVHNELQRLNALSRKYGQLATLLWSYHGHVLAHVRHTLLPAAATSQHALVLMRWLCHDYFSVDFLGDPDFQSHRQPLDMLSYTEAVVSVRETLLSTLQMDVQNTLDHIFELQGSMFWRSSVFHVEVIKCIDEPIAKAKSINETLQHLARRLSLLQLQKFLERFNVAKQQLVKKYKKTPVLVVETCLKTLNTCHGFVTYIQASPDGEARDSTAEETLSKLESLDTHAFRAMEGALVLVIKDHLKRHFKTNGDTLLLREIKEMFSDGEYSPDVQKRFLGLLDERLSALYLWSLHSSRQKKQKKQCHAGAVTRDAELLILTFSDLHPGLRLSVLLKVEELVVSQDADSVKLTLSMMTPLCQSEKVKDQLPHLLRLTHLTKSQRQEVLEAEPAWRPSSSSD